MRISLLVTLIILALFTTSCTLVVKQPELDEVKGQKDCLLSTEGMKWKDVGAVLGEPDVAPLPEKGRPLHSNARVYREKVVIFYVDRKKVKLDGGTRFYEVVEGVEICR